MRNRNVCKVLQVFMFYLVKKASCMNRLALYKYIESVSFLICFVFFSFVWINKNEFVAALALDG